MFNELVHSGVEGLVSTPNCPLPITEDFEVYRKVRSDKGVSRGPRKEVKPVKVTAVKRGPRKEVKPVKVTAVKRGAGRPRVYNGKQRRIVAAALRKYGYTHGLTFLRKEHKLNVSKTLARDVAVEVGLTFKRGRPAA